METGVSLSCNVTPTKLGLGAVEPLLDALDEEFPYARSNACWALGYVGAERALEPLEDVRNTDPNEEVQNAASAAINEITDR